MVAVPLRRVVQLPAGGREGAFWLVVSVAMSIYAPLPLVVLWGRPISSDFQSVTSFGAALPVLTPVFTYQMEIGFNRVNYIIETSTGAVESGLDQIGLDWMGLEWKYVTKRHQLGPWNLTNGLITCLDERLTCLWIWIGLDWIGKMLLNDTNLGPVT